MLQPIRISAIAFTVGVLITSTVSATSEVQYTDGLFISPAALRNSRFLQELELLGTDELRDRRRELAGISAHRIGPGVGVVLGYRRFSHQLGMVSDTESFEKLTLELPEIAGPSDLDWDIGDHPELNIVYSEGSSVWSASGCSGYVRSGRLVIIRAANALKVTVQGPVELVGNYNSRCGSMTVAVAFEATKIRLAELTPWLGAEADIWQEAFRPGRK
jgi:hypothetical protein